MTEPESGESLSPAQEEQVRRLLAEARHQAPVPDDVAGRLEVTLAGLRQERLEEREREKAVRAGRGGAPVVDLAARRRRRASAVLVAAAAVVAVGVGVGQLVEPNRNDTVLDSADGDGQAAADAPNAYEEAAPSLAESGKPQGADKQALAPPPEVSSGHFRRDVTRIRPRAELPDAQSRALTLLADSSFMCEPADWGPGDLLPVLYDALPAVLAYRPATGDTQVVDLVQCGTGMILRSTVIPAS